MDRFFTEDPWAQECRDPVTLFGAAALGPTISGAAVAGGTAGLFGTAGAFSLGTTLSTLGTALGAAGALSSIGSSGQESAAREAQLEADAQADEFNARIARENAALVGKQTAAQLEQADRDRRLRVGANIASGGASGIGQSFDILQSSAAQEELNLLNIQSEGLLKQRSFQQSASLDTASAKNKRNQKPLVRSAGKAKSATAVLSGLSSGATSASNLGIF